MKRKPRAGPLARIDEEALASFSEGCGAATRTLRCSLSCGPPRAGSGARRRCASSPRIRRRPFIPRRSSSASAAGTRRSAGARVSYLAASPRAPTSLDSYASSARSSGGLPTARDLEARRERMPSKSLYWHTFGSLGGCSARGRLRRADRGGAARACDRSGDGARSDDSAGYRSSPTGRSRERTMRSMLTEWQVYRMLDVGRGSVVGLSVPRSRAARRGRVVRHGARADGARHLRLAGRSALKRPHTGADERRVGRRQLSSRPLGDRRSSPCIRAGSSSSPTARRGRRR